MNKRNLKIMILVNVVLLVLFILAINIFNQDSKNNIPIEDTTDACLTSEYRKIYLSTNQEYVLNDIDYISDDANIVSIFHDKVIANKVGKTTIKNKCNHYDIIVTDIITDYVVNMDKEYLPCNRYSKQDNELLDDILKSRIDEKGYHTRAAVVEAARFILLNFPYKLKYFYENGRINGIERSIDGEGRYYHLGLYLNEYKTEQIKEVMAGPCIWGCQLFQYETNELNENGLDCSGFITWAFYNAGYNSGDLGAGPSTDINDLTDLGKVVYMDELNITDLKVGDLIGFDGHIGMIIGIKDNNIYVGEAYWVNDLQVRIYTRKELLESKEWEYVILMDDYYKKDGNLSNYWD